MMYRVKSVYVNNFKCLQNFELNLGSSCDLLLLAKNGMGKSSVLAALRILRRIAIGEGNVENLFSAGDFAFGNYSSPIRFKITLSSEDGDCVYNMAVGKNANDKLIVLEESLVDGDKVVFSKAENRQLSDSQLMLPLVKGASDYIALLTDWILIMPIPSAMITGRTVVRKLDFDCGNFISWLKHFLGSNPTAYDDLDREIKVALPDCASFAWNEQTEEPEDNLYLTFKANDVEHSIEFGSLSDGEKISVLGAALIVLARFRPGFFCFWDEPDNYLAVSEVQCFITRLRKYLIINNCQLIVNSHNLETIRTIGIDATKMLCRRSHQEPARLVNCADKFTTDAGREQYINAVLSGELYVD